MLAGRKVIADLPSSSVQTGPAVTVIRICASTGFKAALLRLDKEELEAVRDGDHCGDPLASGGQRSGPHADEGRRSAQTVRFHF